MNKLFKWLKAKICKEKRPKIDWLISRPTMELDIDSPRYKKYSETSEILQSLYEATTEDSLPDDSTPFYLGDYGHRTTAKAGMAIWLIVNASQLFREISISLETNNTSSNLDPVTLTTEILNMLIDETQFLDNDTQRKLIAQLMVSLGVGLLPATTDWEKLLFNVFELQLEHSTGRGWEAPVLRWALSIQIGEISSLEEREKSFQSLLETKKTDDYWDLNNWAYLLLRLEIWLPATPMAKQAVIDEEWSASLDTLGWSLCYEGLYVEAENILIRALKELNQDDENWYETQYHRLQVTFWSKRFEIAHEIISHFKNCSTENTWISKAEEIENLLDNEDYEIIKEKQGIYEYDIAISFANEDREYAFQLAKALKNNRVNVFYDDFERSKIWGRDLYAYWLKFTTKRPGFA